MRLFAGLNFAGDFPRLGIDHADVGIKRIEHKNRRSLRQRGGGTQQRGNETSGPQTGENKTCEHVQNSYPWACECNERYIVTSQVGFNMKRMSLIQLKHARLEVRQVHAPAHAAHKAPLVFLHEGLGSVAMWHTREGFWPEQVCAATGRAGWVYSRQGYGESDPIADVRGTGRHAPTYMHTHALETLPELLATLGIARPVLLGHSDGGTIALLHASAHTLSGGIVMAPHVMVEDVSILAIEAARDAYVNGNLRERLTRFHRDVDNAFWQWNDVWLSDAFRAFDIRDACRRIACPMLALQGVDDPYGSLQQIEDIHPSGPITRVAIPHCGHSPHRDQPHATLDAIVGFLADLP